MIRNSSIVTVIDLWYNKYVTLRIDTVLLLIYLMIPGSKGLCPLELAHKWVIDLGTRQNMSIEVGR